MKTKSALEIYKGMNRNDSFRNALKILCYSCMEGWGNPTDDEYEVLSGICIDTYLHYEDVDLTRLCDCVFEQYFYNDTFTLDEAEKMSRQDCLRYYVW